MPVSPRLLNPTSVTVTQIDGQKQRIDRLRRTPVNHIAKQASFKIDAQVKWNMQLGDYANPQMTSTGPDEREMGYIVVLVKDLKKLSKELKRGDRINVAGQFSTNFYIVRVEFGSHYNREFTLVKAVFTDRLGKDGKTTPVVGPPAPEGTFTDEIGNTMTDEDDNPFSSDP